MAESVFVVNPAGWAKAFKTWDVGVLGTWMGRKVVTAEQTAKLLVPAPGNAIRNRTGQSYATGRLKASIRSDKSHAAGGDLEAKIGSGLAHASYVEHGTSPHVIAPRTAALLKFRSRTGVMVYTPIVHHPGTRATPFLGPSLLVFT